MLKEKSLPRELWGEAVNTAVYLLNRSSTLSLQGGTSYEAWTGRKPSIAHLRVFGSIVHVKCTKTPQKKLEDCSTPMIFIGYEVGTKAYRCFDPVNATVHTSRDVLFEEDGKWDWTNHSEGISTLTFNPSLCVESISEDSSHPERDRDEDHEENFVEATTPQSESHEPEPCRYKSLTQVYSETDPMQAEGEECLLISEEPSTYAEAAREEVWKRAMKKEMEAIDESFSCVVKSQRRWSKKFIKSNSQR